MCDQLRYDIVKGKLDFVKTPNIDRIKEKGIIFNNAYSQTPVCVPARYSFLSGLSPFKIGMLENCPSSPIIENSLPQMLKKTRCACFAVGKMHFNPCRMHYGFDRVILSEEIPGHIQDDDYLLYLKEKGYGHIDEPNGMRSENYYVPQISQLPEHLHSSYFVGEKSAEIIKNNRNRPFFLFSSFIKPHPPFDPVKDYEKMYKLNEIPLPVRKEEEKNPVDRAIKIQNDYKINGIENLSLEDECKIRRAYFATITQLDKGIGLILDELDKYGLFDETLIIFTSDHGEMLGDHYSYGKRTFFEPSAKIPLIIKMPQGTKGEYDGLVTHTDLYATIIDYMGEKVPDSCDGESLIESIKTNNSIRDHLFCEYGSDQNFKFMYRQDNFKLIYYAEEGQVQLFDLSKDPEELNNIAETHTELVKKILSEAEKYYTENKCKDAVENGKLKKLPYMEIERKGFLNQRPKWRWSVIDD